MSEPITDATSVPAVDVAALQAQVAALTADNADLKLRAAGATAGLVPQSYLDAVNNDLAKAKEQIASLQATIDSQTANASPGPDPATQKALENAAQAILTAKQKQSEDAATIARTAVTEASASAREATYAANADVLRGVQIVATLDSRTTQVCRHYDGKVFPVNEGPGRRSTSTVAPPPPR